MKQAIKENYEAVLQKIAPFAKERKITVLAATKMQSVEDINYLISLGVDTIGENRVNELVEKYEGYDKRASVHLNQHVHNAINFGASLFDFLGKR